MDYNLYDITKLEKLNKIDIENAIKQFPDHQSYFNKLNIFVEESKRYLRAYTPSVVIYDEENRKDFLHEAEKVRDTLMSLGMIHSVSTIFDLEAAISNGSINSLSDGLTKFYAEMDVMAKLITSARTEKPIILAVDDKPELLTAVVSMLEERFKVIAVTSGKAAIKVIEKYTPELFLLDIEMPQMNGYELAKIIRKDKRFQSSPIIFLTGKGTRDDVIAAIKNGGNDYIIKPVDKELLVSKMKQYLE